MSDREIFLNLAITEHRKKASDLYDCVNGFVGLFSEHPALKSDRDFLEWFDFVPKEVRAVAKNYVKAVEPEDLDDLPRKNLRAKWPFFIASAISDGGPTEEDHNTLDAEEITIIWHDIVVGLDYFANTLAKKYAGFINSDLGRKPVSAGAIRQAMDEVVRHCGEDDDLEPTSQLFYEMLKIVPPKAASGPIPN